MTERNNHQDLSIIGRYLRYKYWFIGSVIFSLLIAFIYLSFQPKQYKVSGKFILTGNTLSTDDLRSKATVQKMLSQLPFQVSYFQHDTAMYSNTIPLKIVLLNQNIDTAAQLTATVVDEQVVKIIQNDTISYYYFNKPINDYPFAKFKIVKGPNFHSRESIIPVVVKFNDPNRQLEEYYKNFDIKPVGDDSKYLAISIITATPENGEAFLNQLVKAGNGSNADKTPDHTILTDEGDNKAKINTDISILKNKYAQLEHRAEMLKNVKESSQIHNAIKKPSDLQLQVLDAIKPYAKSPVNQFVQIPDSYQVNDIQLEQLIVDFNNIELRKQRTLRDSQANRAKITSLNEQIVILKTSILNKIDISKKGSTETPPVVPISSVSISYAALNDSVSMIGAQVKALQKSYASLPAAKTTSHIVTTPNPQLSLIKDSIESSSYPNAGIIYLFALLAGLVVPLAFPYLSYLRFIFPKLRISDVVDLKKAGDWISELTQVKEID